MSQLNRPMPLVTARLHLASFALFLSCKQYALVTPEILQLIKSRKLIECHVTILIDVSKRHFQVTIQVVKHRRDSRGGLNFTPAVLGYRERYLMSSVIVIVNTFFMNIPNDVNFFEWVVGATSTLLFDRFLGRSKPSNSSLHEERAPVIGLAAHLVRDQREPVNTGRRNENWWNFDFNAVLLSYIDRTCVRT